MNRLVKALMLVNLQFLLLIPTCAPQKTDRGIKSSDQYWSETGLGSKELLGLISKETCYSGQQNFLACVNAISQMAERYNLALTADAQFRPMTAEDVAQRASEKKELSKWLPVFQQAEASLPVTFIDLWHELDSKYIQKGERSAVIASGINGFLSVYKDPHTYIMPLHMYEEVVANSENKNTNVGFVARRADKHLIVRKVYEGSPAEVAGFHKGDRIIAINGESVSGLLQSRVNDLLKMKTSNRIGLEIERDTQSGTIRKQMELIKTETVYPAVVSKLLEGNQRVGLVTIHKFGKNVCDITKEKILSLKEQNIQGVMLDLRDNPGGQVEEAACIANLFLDRGTLLFETRYLDNSRPSDKYIAEHEPIFSGPVAVLINSGSASASEIVAGVLKDQNRAKLIGEKTFGKGSFQDGRIWGPNEKIALFQTEGLYYFPSGWTPQLVGLEPDIVVNFNNAENSREQELFFNPIMPIDNWLGPQSLSWLTEKDCDMDLTILQADRLTAADPQMQKAQAWLACGGEKNGRNGSL